MMRKGQMEILGLVVVMVLVTVGLLFVIRFVVLGDDSSDVRGEFTESQLSANLLNALLQTTLEECGNNKVKELFRDCALTESITCENGEPSCAYLNHTVEEILNKTLGEWNRDYHFNATETPINYGDTCEGEYDSKFYPIQAEHKTVVVKLQVCSMTAP